MRRAEFEVNQQEKDFKKVYLTVREGIQNMS